MQAANDKLTFSDRWELQKEIDQLQTEIDGIAKTTEFNTKKLLDGSTAALAATDNLTTKVLIRDGLRVEDQLGQHITQEGNFPLEIAANPGTSQVQKTGIMSFKAASGTEVTNNSSYVLDFFKGYLDVFRIAFQPAGMRRLLLQKYLSQAPRNG